MGNAAGFPKHSSKPTGIALRPLPPIPKNLVKSSMGKHSGFSSTAVLKRPDNARITKRLYVHEA